MAGSRTSPVLRDQWNADPDRDPRDRERRRGRGSGRDRGRNRGRDRGRPYRPNNRNFDRSGRSPPRASRFGPDSSHDLGDFAPDRSPPRGSPPPRNFHNGRRLDSTQPMPSTGDWNAHSSGPFDREAPGFRRDEVSTGPPQKRQRTRSPSPRGGRGPLPPPRPNYSDNWDIRDRSPPSFKKRGGRNQGRGAPRRRSPRRGRDRRGKDRRRPDITRPGRSRSPIHERGFHPSPDRRSRTPGGDNYSDHGSHYRSNSRHSIRSATSRYSESSRRSRRDSAMNTNRPIQSVVDDTARSPSPPRPIPSLDSDNFGEHSTHSRDELPMHAMPRRRPSRPHLDTRPYATPQNATSTGSYHGSPQPPSPYSARGGWSAQPPYPGTDHVSPYRHDDYSTQNGNYYHNKGQFHGPGNHHPQSPYGGPAHRGGHSGGGHRGNFSNQGPDRRFSGSGSHPYHNGPSQRGAKGHFNNLQWTASGSRGRGGQHSPDQAHSHGSQTPNRPPSHNDPQSPRAGETDGYSRTSHRDEEHNQTQPQSADGNPQSMPPPAHEYTETTPANKGGKFSFAFKPKAAASPAPKPVPDLAQRMQVHKPATRAPEPPQQPRNRFTNGPLPKFKPEPRGDRRDRDRGRNRDRREFREPREFRDPRDRRDNRRFDQRHDRRQGERPQDRPLDWQDRRRDPSPEPPREAPKQKRILTRPKPRPTLPEEFANADSVYYRKPGNESVIGAGTYGKVFKGIHVYTQRKVALKKIRMEGEKDGFPVTAVREIKLLQHLRNHNVVSLLEVMVEKNECFMVFEYLSHDLTGLINHPTFSLTLSHKKDLAKQMFEGLNYLHHRGVLHRDIKAANILISNRGLLKFADFGLARFFSKSRQLDYTNRVITIWYRPPELLLGETRYGPAVDVWSAACVCMEMFTKKAVFPGEGGELSQVDKIYNALGTPTKTEWPDLVEMPWFHLMRPTERRKRVFEDVYRDVLTTGAMDLISSIFRYDPSQRPSAEDVLKHPYFVSEEPSPHPPIEYVSHAPFPLLEHVEGDWHEFESKALRKEARRVEYQNQKDKRKADTSVPSSDRDSKRTKQDSSDLVSAQ
ncbi:Pc21g16250 [Penicillium rubens Wisconsin 54-1255]|uniref:cyclin-dependent kinase n=1 Tax=Penicillium rubens (strain ATCC 28089 / DSM 1075 / NRRL 1951 / Wisconsin 54-1255) TaxID=500485 RepID=B6HKY3_PENRW|nr:Pc21g16250 [Penicillium rubens Wisconsin 54-1255]